MAVSDLDPSATLGKNSLIGAGCVIGANVSIGPECRICNFVVIHEGTKIGAGVRIDDHAIIGKQPMKARRSAMTTKESRQPAVVGDNVQIGASAVLYADCSIGAEVLIADLATVREGVRIGDESIIGRGVAVENDCTIGKRCKIQTNAYITARTTIRDHVFIAPGVLTSNDNFLGRTEERLKHFCGPTFEEACRIGVGAIILPGRTVGSEAVVAAGAVLATDADAGTVYMGIPARPTGPVPEEQKLGNGG